ncbi:uncharacterized protein LOC144866504 isoform X1 [Branchiostoma floridae x Branchiostoma japonicum]
MSGEELYPGAPITTVVSYALIMMFGIKHNLTYVAFQDLIKLIQAHCPKSKKLARSLYKTKKFFTDRLCKETKQTTHYCCRICQKILAGENSVCDNDKCRNAKAMEFYSLDIESQIQRFFEDPLFRNSLRRQSSNESDAEGHIRDVYDGRKYKELTKAGGFLEDGKNITFCFNTDGVSIFRSSRGGELWPVFLAINELPPQMRFTKKYMILCACWFAPEKPKMTTFLKPTMMALDKIYRQGIVVKVSPTETATVRGLLMMAVMDLPAKAKALVMKQFNGMYGCNECGDSGKNPDGSNNSLHRIWPYTADMTMRSHRSIIENVRETLSRSNPGNAVMGIMGASVFLRYHALDMSNSFPVDWMHAVLLGVAKTMLELWFSPQSYGEPFNISKSIPDLNKQLLALKVPDCISHRPRSITEKHHWKASEFRSWLLYYSMPLLHDVLPAEYVAHYFLLVSAIWTLASDDITTADLTTAGLRLDAFCKSFEELYGERRQTMNIHKLRHLQMYVEMYGPVWTTSLFGFESMNGHLKRMVHGTRFIVTQITFTKSMSWGLQRVAAAMENIHERKGVVKLAQRLTSVAERPNSTRLCSGLYLLGNPVDRHVHEEHLEAVRTAVGHVDNTIKYPYFHRIELNGQAIYSREYGREKTRNSRTVEFEVDGAVHFGEVVTFCNIGTTHLAVLQDLLPIATPLIDCSVVQNLTIKVALQRPLSEKVFEVRRGDTYRAVPITSLRRKCVFMSTGVRTYIGRFPNVVEKD